ncbi:CapA family protein [Synechococcus elongatus IITB4]|uniref:CapA family protein n=1 Tax=Synechococcus elongatus TaxID=32046 RepID=UPI0030CB1EF8
MRLLSRSQEKLVPAWQERSAVWLGQGLAIAASFATAFSGTMALLRWSPLQWAIAPSPPISPAVADELPANPAPPPAAFEFTLTAVGDSGWTRSHQRINRYQKGFRQAYFQFDPKRQYLGDLNYLNWETSVGIQCDQFWAPPTDQTFAFVTHPQELRDAIDLGFNLIGLANNHSFDCLRSPEGQGVNQTLKYLQDIQEKASQPLVLSGVRQSSQVQPKAQQFSLPNGQISVLMISAYVGGDRNYCQKVICASHLNRYQALLKQHRGLRILALHSWNPASHAQLKRILQRSLQQGLIDVGIGSGPHIAERVEIVSTPRGPGIYASSLGNFIHPSLMAQPYNLMLSSRWSYQPDQQQLKLQSVTTLEISCTPSTCQPRRQKLRWSQRNSSDHSQS